MANKPPSAAGAATEPQGAFPSVGVVIPTRDRPEMLRRALSAALEQDYPGELRAVVVYDRSEPDESLASDRVQVIVNRRTPGLAGARNSGIDALDTDLVAFCDDDDEWLPGKLAAQVEALRAEPEAILATTATVMDFNGRSIPRRAGLDRVEYTHLLRDRLFMLGSSTYLARRLPLLEIGLVDESIPGSQGEDWDLALRAARRHPIVNVDHPYVRILWGTTSYYAQAWDIKIAALHWFLERYPEMGSDPAAAGRIYGQIAFGHAYNRRRREALRWSGRALRANWRERRVPVALAVTSGAVSGRRVLQTLNARGRGI
ncbi:glycosyltransferase family 2 protein [Thermomonospora umbrina]|uniref:Glycosyl transferase family 2 n=1 Tax=Thermomonospora umbrina TaxID=111806 RepID=A0A3D9ST64_9ACTN|nr:glycosyltransferase family 2 protein [Thermomonospora umbrina]REE96165.1 glycosyl transferase family 2 [Thermomonospora umbrina]